MLYVTGRLLLKNGCWRKFAAAALLATQCIAAEARKLQQVLRGRWPDMYVAS